MFAYLENNKKGSKDIVIAKVIGDDKKIREILPNDDVPNHTINSFVYQSMSYFFGDEGTLFNTFADSKQLFNDDLINSLYLIKGWLNYYNENTSRIEITKISSAFAKFYYDVLPLITVKEVERIPLLRLPIVVNSLDATKKRKQEVYRSLIVSAMNNEQFLFTLKGHIKIENKESLKVKVK